MISYAGIDLGYQTGELVGFIEATISPADLWLWSARSFPGSRLTAFPFRQPHLPPRVEIGTLWWPTGASRFSCAHYLVDQTQLDAIRAVIYATGIASNNYRAAPLVLNDGVNSITTDLWMLPARPLQGLTDYPLYLLSLVDDRYFWWYKSSSLTVTATTTTWTQLLAAIATALGITIDLDPIAAAYLWPDAAFTLRDEPLPLLLDAACMCIGHRFVRQLSGICETWDAEDSRDTAADQLAELPTAGDIDGSAGGVFALGTALPLEDDVTVLPATVEVVFPVSVAGTASGSIAYQVTLASLALADFADIFGHPGVKTFHSSARANGIVPTNTAELLALARRIATDFYRWQCGRLDLRLVGYPAWNLTGLDDSATYEHGGDCATRIVRGPWQDHLEELLHASSWGSGGGGGTPGSTTGLTVEESIGLPVFTDVRTLTLNTPDGFRVTQDEANQAHVHYASASVTQKGAMDTVAQSFAGGKQFQDNIGVGGGPAFGAGPGYIGRGVPGVGSTIQRPTTITGQTGPNVYSVYIPTFFLDSGGAALVWKPVDRFACLSVGGAIEQGPGLVGVGPPRTVTPIFCLAGYWAGNQWRIDNHTFGAWQNWPTFVMGNQANPNFSGNNVGLSFEFSDGSGPDRTRCLVAGVRGGILTRTGGLQAGTGISITNAPGTGATVIISTTAGSGIAPVSGALLSSSGATQAAATLATADTNVYSIPDAGNRGARLPDATEAGTGYAEIVITNTDPALALQVYPPSGGTINLLGVDVANLHTGPITKRYISTSADNLTWLTQDVP